MVSWDIDRACVSRREKANKRASEIFKTKLRLVRGGVHKTRSCLGFAGDADMDEIKNALDANGGEEVFRRAQRGEARAEIRPTLDIQDVLLDICVEAGGHPKGSRR